MPGNPESPLSQVAHNQLPRKSSIRSRSVYYKHKEGPFSYPLADSLRPSPNWPLPISVYQRSLAFPVRDNLQSPSCSLCSLWLNPPPPHHILLKQNPLLLFRCLLPVRVQHSMPLLRVAGAMFGQRPATSLAGSRPAPHRLAGASPRAANTSFPAADETSQCH